MYIKVYARFKKTLWVYNVPDVYTSVIADSLPFMMKILNYFILNIIITSHTRLKSWYTSVFSSSSSKIWDFCSKNLFIAHIGLLIGFHSDTYIFFVSWFTCVFFFSWINNKTASLSQVREMCEWECMCSSPLYIRES